MNLNNFTIKSQEAVQQAQQLAANNEQQSIEPAHLLKGLMEVDENVIPFILKKVNANVNNIVNGVDTLVKSYPRVSGIHHLFSHLDRFCIRYHNDVLPATRSRSVLLGLDIPKPVFTRHYHTPGIVPTTLLITYLSFQSNSRCRSLRFLQVSSPLLFPASDPSGPDPGSENPFYRRTNGRVFASDYKRIILPLLDPLCPTSDFQLSLHYCSHFCHSFAPLA